MNGTNHLPTGTVLCPALSHGKRPEKRRKAKFSAPYEAVPRFVGHSFAVVFSLFVSQLPRSLC